MISGPLVGVAVVVGVAGVVGVVGVPKKGTKKVPDDEKAEGKLENELPEPTKVICLALVGRRPVETGAASTGPAVKTAVPEATAAAAATKWAEIRMVNG